MPLSGSPPTYTRGYSFTQHSIDQPNVPQPGDKLDQEFDDIATAVNDGNEALQGILNADGTLKDGSVGISQLAPGVFDTIVDDAELQIQPMVDQAQAAATQAANSRAAARTSELDAETAANTALGAVALAQDTMDAAQASAATAHTESEEAKHWAEQAENSANTSEAAMVQALGHKDTALAWAEYLAGPVDPAPPGWPEAIDDGRWSAKWWALKARDFVGQYGNFYLGAFPSPPAPPTAPGTPAWQPGQLYFDTTTGLMMVWDGVYWKPLSTPAPAARGVFVYIAADGQQDFSGPDLYGNTPVINDTLPETSAVALNGVLLVEDKAGTGDYAVDEASDTLHLYAPVGAGAVVQWVVFLSPDALAPRGSATIHKLSNAWPFDGVATTFPMTYVRPSDGTTQPVTPGNGVQIGIRFDGVDQEPGVDFTTVGSDLVFAHAPAADAKCWGTWSQPA